MNATQGVHAVLSMRRARQANKTVRPPFMSNANTRSGRHSHGRRPRQRTRRPCNNKTSLHSDSDCYDTATGFASPPTGSQIRPASAKERRRTCTSPVRTTLATSRRPLLEQRAPWHSEGASRRSSSCAARRSRQLDWARNCSRPSTPCPAPSSPCCAWSASFGCKAQSQ